MTEDVIEQRAFHILRQILRCSLVCTTQGLQDDHGTHHTTWYSTKVWPVGRTSQKVQVICRQFQAEKEEMVCGATYCQSTLDIRTAIFTSRIMTQKSFFLPLSHLFNASSRIQTCRKPGIAFTWVHSLSNKLKVAYYWATKSWQKEKMMQTNKTIVNIPWTYSLE